MRSKDNLFQLIQAMTKSEKRYFVLDAKKGGRNDSRYLALFDAINNMPEGDDSGYDETGLKATFGKSLSSDKAYLYEAILRSMRDYRSQSSKAAQVKERLMDAKYLYERRLYDLSTARLMEAKEMAAELEDQFTLLEINREEQVSLFDRKAMVKLEHIEKLSEERDRTLEAIREELQYLDLYYRLMVELYRDFKADDSKRIEHLRKTLPLELLSEQKQPHNPQALRRYYQCNMAYYIILGNIEKVYEHSLKAVKWWEEFPALKGEEFHRYIINVANLINNIFKMDKHLHEADEWYEKLKRENKAGSIHNERVIFQNISLAKLLHHLNKGEFYAASKILPEIIKGMKEYKVNNIALAGNIATVYFLVRNYQKCNEWVETILKEMKTGGRLDIQRVIRIYKIISLYELDEHELADLEIRATTRFFKLSSSANQRIEELILNTYLRQIFNSPVSEFKSSVMSFKKYLTEVKSQPSSESILGIDELLIWADSKLKTT